MDVETERALETLKNSLDIFMTSFSISVTESDILDFDLTAAGQRLDQLRHEQEK